MEFSDPKCLGLLSQTGEPSNSISHKVGVGGRVAAGFFEVQMFLSHALLSEAVGCVGNVV